MLSKKAILRTAMSKKHYGQTCFDFLDAGELTMIYSAMDTYAKQFLEAKNGWIDVRERTPELIEGKNHSDNVLVICNGQIEIMCYCHEPIEEELGNGFFWDYPKDKVRDWVHTDYNITHWQYLPKPITI